jgi:predicted aminopeptidase
MAFLTACSPGYVLRAGWEEAKILTARRPIHEIVHDTTASAELRGKLRLVQHAREYSERTLELVPGDAFTSYVELERDTLLMVVNAAHEFELRWKTWWFPIVGRLPYKGYFDFDKARREGEKLDEQGYDTWVRPSSAFSTLGWFPDPLMSTTLRADSVGIVETVIHEITHSTFFPKGQARFNESFANFVGHRGAISFFCDAIADEESCETAEDRWHDIRVFGRFFHSVLDPLEALYACTLRICRPTRCVRRRQGFFGRQRRGSKRRSRPSSGRDGTADWIPSASTMPGCCPGCSTTLAWTTWKTCTCSRAA